MFENDVKTYSIQPSERLSAIAYMFENDVKTYSIQPTFSESGNTA